MADSSDPNDWTTYQKLILHRLDAQHSDIQKVKDDVSGIRTEDIPGLKTEIALLKLKSGVFGALAGMIPVLIALLLKAI